MKAWTIAGAGLVLMSGVGIAMAQAPAAPPGAPPAAPPVMSPGAAAPGPAGGPAMDGGPGRGPMGGPMGPMQGHWPWRHHRMGGMMPPPPPPPSKAAHFRLRKGDAVMDIKCADDEPMKACVDAASALLDKAAAQK